MTMESNFKASVIIPVYNAEKFLVNAVESAVDMEEVGEIILVEDNSPDSALEICQELEQKYSKIKLFRHPNGENRGASGSRNLGIKKSSYDYIAFLDADDWYLPGRFLKDKEIFAKHLRADVVYSSVKNEGQNNLSMKNSKIKDVREVIGINAIPEEFYKYLLTVEHPAFHTNSVTIRKSFLLEDKLFDERLKLHQDSELWKRLLRRGYFYSGNLIEPVAIIRKHEANRITSRNADSRLKMYAVFIKNVGIENLLAFEKVHLIDNIIRTKSKNITNHWQRRFYYYFKKLSTRNKDKFLRVFSISKLS